MIDDPTKLRFSSYHLAYDPEKHVAAWGARLILQEVLGGSRGIVWDRQDVSKGGIPQDRIDQFDHAFLSLLDKVREAASYKYAWGGSDEQVQYRDGDILYVASPQTSYGYLYVTGVIEK